MKQWHVVGAVLVAGLMNVGAMAQGGGSAGQPAPTPPPPAPAPTAPPTPAVPANTTGVPAAATAQGVLLDGEPFRLDSVGLVIRLPRGVRTEMSDIGGVVTVQIYPDDRSWVVNVQTPRVEPGMGTAEQAAERIIKQFNDALPMKSTISGEKVDNAAKMITPLQQLNIEGCGEVGRRFAFAMPRRDKSYVVQAYSIFRPLPDRFVVFELVCGDGVYEQARGFYEVIVAAALFEKPELLIAQRRAAVESGIALLGKLTSEDWAKGMPEEQRWYRLYRPALSGKDEDAQEGGYRSVRFFKGTRAQMSPGATNIEPGPANPEGYLCQVDARVLLKKPQKLGAAVDAAEYQVIDTQGIYFLSLDRNEEAWTVRTTVNDPAKKRGSEYSETGARTGKTMTVALNTPGDGPKTIKPVIQGEGYLSQFESQLWPRMLVTAKKEGETGAYVYRSESQTIVLRRDTVIKDPKGRAMYAVVTRHREEPEGQKSAYSDDGELMRTELSDGRVWEPISPVELLRLYRSKGLPAGSASKSPDRGR